MLRVLMFSALLIGLEIALWLLLPYTPLSNLF